MARTMTGAEMVIKALQDQGVEHIFGYPAALCFRSTTRSSSRIR